MATARSVVFAPEALADLLRLYEIVSEASSPERAYAYVESLRSHCSGFAEFPERGTRRDEVRPGLRTVGFQRRVTIAFHITAETVVIDRLLYGGRDAEALLREDPDD